MGICLVTAAVPGQGHEEDLEKSDITEAADMKKVGHACCVIRTPKCKTPRHRVAPKLTTGADHALVRLEAAVGHLERSQFVFPLSEKEIYQLYGSWELVKKDFIATGVRMFARMFEMSPRVKDSFEKFRSLGEDQTEVMESKVLETHGMVVMFAVDEIINCIDDPDSAIELLLEQGKSHARFGDLSEEVFWAIEQPFLYAVKQALGFKFNEQLQEIYSKTIHFILSIIISGFRQSQLAKARKSVSDTLFAGVSGSLPLATTALMGRSFKHNVIQKDKDDPETTIKEDELIDLESVQDYKDAGL